MYICLNRGTAGGSLPFEQFVQLAAESGFPGCDVDMGYVVQHGTSALRDLFAGRKLRFGGWGPPVDWRAEASKQSDGLTQLKTCAAAARELGIDSCCTWIMPSSQPPFIENWDFHVERLKPVARVLAEQGLRFGLEFVAPYHLRRHFPHEFLFTPGQMLELADAVGPNVGLLVDCFHCHCSGTTWEHLAQIPGKRIVLAHLNDAPKQPVATISDGDRLLPGEGAIDPRAFLGALRTAGYDGPVSLEVFSAQLKTMPPLDAARKAWAACKTLLANSGA